MTVPNWSKHAALTYPLKRHTINTYSSFTYSYIRTISIPFQNTCFSKQTVISARTHLLISYAQIIIQITPSINKLSITTPEKIDIKDASRTTNCIHNITSTSGTMIALNIIVVAFLLHVRLLFTLTYNQVRATY